MSPWVEVTVIENGTLGGGHCYITWQLGWGSLLYNMAPWVGVAVIEHGNLVGGSLL